MTLNEHKTFFKCLYSQIKQSTYILQVSQTTKPDNKQLNIHMQKELEITKNNLYKETKEIASKLNIDHKINCIAEQPTFITIKNYKPNFKIKLPYRLINPIKSEIVNLANIYYKHVRQCSGRPGFNPRSRHTIDF